MRARRTPNDVIFELRSGAEVEVSAKYYGSTDLHHMAVAAREGGGRLTIAESDILDSKAKRLIANAGGSSVALK